MRPDAGDAAAADIYITAGAGQTPTRLTAHPADDHYPAWSADGATLAFIRRDGRNCDIMLMPLLRQGRERRLTACGNLEEPRVSWSKNGDWLIESFAPGPDPIRGWQIARVSTTTGVRETLTLPAPGSLGDYNPAVSPDGTRIAFVRGINGATSDVHVIPIGGGAPTRITWDNQDLVGVDWSADGNSLLRNRLRRWLHHLANRSMAATALVVGGAAN